jgi:hypothetical protein
MQALSGLSCSASLSFFCQAGNERRASEEEGVLQGCASDYVATEPSYGHASKKKKCYTVLTQLRCKRTAGTKGGSWNDKGQSTNPTSKGSKRTLSALRSNDRSQVCRTEMGKDWDERGTTERALTAQLVRPTNAAEKGDEKRQAPAGPASLHSGPGAKQGSRLTHTYWEHARSRNEAHMQATPH